MENDSISEEERNILKELEEKLGEVAEERNQEVQQQREAQEPVSQIERILNAGWSR